MTGIDEDHPSFLWPGDTLADHLEFALKYDGTNIHLLSVLFRLPVAGELTQYVRSKPLGKYARRLWYLYERITGQRLDVPDLETGAAVDLLEPAEYFVVPPVPSRRHRVRDNSMGDARFCPVVRRTEKLAAFGRSDLPDRCRAILKKYPPDVLRRAMRYLYTKETRSSFDIERVTPSASRVDRFVDLLHDAEWEDFVDDAGLVRLQNAIVDPRYCETGYRSAVQNYVGQSVRMGLERVHFVPPRPGDVRSLMDGLIAAHRSMERCGVDPVVHAAAVAFGFVFIYPFEDGNGRIHRFLIHNIMARRRYTPQGMIFPVSAAMLRDPAGYDGALEAFSVPSLRQTDYDLDDHGRLTVSNDTLDQFRFRDLTAQAEALCSFVRSTVDRDLVDEVEFIEKYDRARAGAVEIVDLPDRLLDLFIRLCLQNRGRLSNRKRQDVFADLTDDEVGRLESVVRSEWGEGGLPD